MASQWRRVTTVFCSTIIPTIGRATLSRAVESVLQQELTQAEFEVIVVNDSGKPLQQASWQRSERVQVIHTARRERSVARNTGAAIARGAYLHFLDDDDYLAPNAFEHLWALSRTGTAKTSAAKWLYGHTQLVDRQNNPLLRLRHGLSGNCFIQAMAGEWIPLQSSLIDRQTFFRLGGFNPSLAGPEDIDLLRRLLLEDEIAETPHVVACVLTGVEGSTTDYLHHAEGSRWARESILNAPNAYHAMRLSSIDPFWQGRMLRVYLTSMAWNIQHRRPFQAMSRAGFAMRSLLAARRGIASPTFWRAAARPYASATFRRGIQEAAMQGQAVDSSPRLSEQAHAMEYSL